MRVFLILLVLGFLWACSSGNSVKISGTGSSEIRQTSSGLYINSGLLGLPKDTDISVDTSSDNEMTFSFSEPDEASGEASRQGGSAF